MLSNALAWLQANPLLVTLVLWPLITAGVNLAWKDASEYALTHPRFAAWKKLAQKWGLSPRGTIALIGKLFSKAKLPPPPPDSSGDFGAVATNTDNTVAVKVPSISPAASQRRSLLSFRQLAAAALGLFLPIAFIGAIATTESGCHLTDSQVKTIEQDALTLTQIGCVMSSALTDSKAVADFCHIDANLTPIIEQLIGQREAAKRAGVHWQLGALVICDASNDQ